MDSRLLELLDKYIEENRILKGEYQKKLINRDLYKELLSYFNDNYESLEENKLFITILLDSIYEDGFGSRSFYLLLSKLENPHYNQKNEYRAFITKLRKEYNNILKDLEDIKNRINRNQNNINTAYTARKCFKYKLPMVDKYAIPNLKRIVNYYEASNQITSREAMLCVLDIEGHNRSVFSYRNGNKLEMDNVKKEKREIDYILKSGYEIIPLPEVYPDRLSFLDKIVKELNNTIIYTNKKDLEYLLDNYKNYILDSNEFNYIIISILNNYNNELAAYSELLLDNEAIFRRNTREEILKDYYKCLSEYLIIRGYYNSINDFIIEDNNIEINDEEEQEIGEEKILVYSTSPANPTKAKMISDMSDVPHEYYDTVLDLILKFKDGTISKTEVKHLTNNKKLVRYMELKRDQVRIVFKHVKENIYNVNGVFVKKADNDNTMYQVMASRSIQDISTEDKLNRAIALGKHTEEELSHYVKEKGRKGTR